MSTWSLVSSAWEHVKRKMHPCWSETWIHKISPCRCYATICKIRPLRPKSEFLSNILFVTLWHPEGHAGSSPVRIDVNHQKSSLGKIWKKWLISVDQIQRPVTSWQAILPQFWDKEAQRLPRPSFPSLFTTALRKYCVDKNINCLKTFAVVWLKLKDVFYD